MDLSQAQYSSYINNTFKPKQDQNEEINRDNMFKSISQYEEKGSPKQQATSRHYVDESSMFDICFNPEITESPVSKPKNKCEHNSHKLSAYESNNPTDKYKIVVDSKDFSIGNYESKDEKENEMYFSIDNYTEKRNSINFQF